MHIAEILTKLNMSFLIKDNKLLEKHNETFDNVSRTKKEFESEPVYSEKYLKN